MRQVRSTGQCEPRLSYSQNYGLTAQTVLNVVRTQSWAADSTLRSLQYEGSTSVQTCYCWRKRQVLDICCYPITYVIFIEYLSNSGFLHLRDSANRQSFRLSEALRTHRIFALLPSFSRTCQTSICRNSPMACLASRYNTAAIPTCRAPSVHSTRLSTKTASSGAAPNRSQATW